MSNEFNMPPPVPAEQTETVEIFTVSEKKKDLEQANFDTVQFILPDELTIVEEELPKRNKKNK